MAAAAVLSASVILTGAPVVPDGVAPGRADVRPPVVVVGASPRADVRPDASSDFFPTTCYLGVVPVYLNFLCFSSSSCLALSSSLFSIVPLRCKARAPTAPPPMRD